MKILIAIIAALTLVSCTRQNIVSNSKKSDSEPLAEDTVWNEDEGERELDSIKTEAYKQWDQLESKFNKASLEKKDSLLKELFMLKLGYEYEDYLEPKFDSLIWAFLHDERTFNIHFTSERPKWNIKKSNDGKVKMYSYEQFGGTAKSGRTILQYYDKRGKFKVREIKEKNDDGGIFLQPIYEYIKRSRHGYCLYGGTEVNNQDYYECTKHVPDSWFK